MIFFLFLAVGSTEDSGSSSGSSSKSSSSKSPAKNRDACNLDGCDKTADGWQYDPYMQGGYGQYCYRTKNAANNKWGYCTKHHCMTDKVSGY